MTTTTKPTLCKRRQDIIDNNTTKIYPDNTYGGKVFGDSKPILPQTILDNISRETKKKQIISMWENGLDIEKDILPKYCRVRSTIGEVWKTERELLIIATTRKMIEDIISEHKKNTTKKKTLKH